jgi:hypothetical protein
MICIDLEVKRLKVKHNVLVNEIAKWFLGSFSPRITLMMNYIVVLILSKKSRVILILPNICVTTSIDVLNRERSMECEEIVYIFICLFSYCYVI